MEKERVDPYRLNPEKKCLFPLHSSHTISRHVHHSLAWTVGIATVTEDFGCDEAEKEEDELWCEPPPAPMSFFFFSMQEV